MKTLKFNFSHPFKGAARINIPGKLNSPCKYFLSDSKGSILIEIPLSGYSEECTPAFRYILHQYLQV
ncbi:MAG TPA: hypothetical protein VIM16_08865 [Mucilaginibacter sp.]